ncbi:hypothetical protein GCM10027271_52640 [Saccharopolyspora gloriosae]
MSRWNPFRRFSRRGERRHDAPEDRAATAPAVPPWDGGWRRSAAQDGVLGRGGLGVIQPARFRSSVASFRDHGVLDGGLGHRLAADAPAGTMHGLVRAPTAPVQRAVVADRAVVAPSAPSPSAAADLPFAAPDPAADSSGSGELGVAPVQRSAVRPRRLAPPLTRARPVTGLPPRRVPAAEPSGDAAPPLVQRAPSATAPPRATAVPTAPDADLDDLAVRRPSSPSSEPRPTPSGPENRPALGDPIQRLPSGAVPLHRDSASGETATDPSSPADAPEPMPQVTAPDPTPQATSSDSTASTGPHRPASRRRPAAAPVQRTTANVQRTTPASGNAQGIGAPLTELPKSATPLGTHAPNNPRAGAPAGAAPARPDEPPAHDGDTPPVVPVNPAPVSTPGSAPLLGATPQVQRLLRETTASTGGAARRSEQEPPTVVPPGTGAPEVSAPGTPPPVQRIRRNSRASEDSARPEPTTAGDAGATAGPAEATTPDSPVVQRSSDPAAHLVRTGPAQPLDPPAPTEPDTGTAAVQRRTEPSPGRAAPNAPAHSTTSGDAPRAPQHPGDARSGSTVPDRPGPTAPLVGDSPPVQRLASSAPTPPATSSAAEPAPLPVSRTQHDPERASDGPPEPSPARPAEQAPVQRSVAPPGAVPPNDLVVPRPVPASADQAPSAGSPVVPGTQRELPLPGTSEPASPRPRSWRPVQRVLPLIATRPLPVRTRHAQTGARTPSHRPEAAPAVAPLRWARPDDRAPSPSAPPRIANPPPVQRAPAAPIGERPPNAPVAPRLAASPLHSTVDTPAAPATSPPLAVQRSSPPPAQPRETPPDPAPSTDPAEAKPPIPGVPSGVPVTVVPKEHEPATDDDPAEPDSAGGQDIDELARRLIEPVGRLLRTELRHGRERFGRTYDRRR